MTELTPADVLADLFDCVDFEPVAHDPRHAADIVLKRLTDAGFEVRSAWPVEAGRTQAEIVEEWRAARQDVFDHTSKISEENTERWTRLSIAEHALMSNARAIRTLGGSHE